MTYKLFISDMKEGFEPQKSLIDRPEFFDAGHVKGCYFYLSRHGKLGGDTFTVKADQGIAISLLGDVSGHGSQDRYKLQSYTSGLEKVTDQILSARFDEKSIIRGILSIDKRIPTDSLMAFSLVRILKDGSFYYLNGGENTIMSYKKGRSEDLSERFWGKVPKIGAFSLLGNEEKVLQEVSFFKDKLTEGDRILIFTDGVAEYSETRQRGKEELKQERLCEIQEQLCTGKPLDIIIQEINKSAQTQLRKLHEDLADDYTIIGLGMV
jgi:serine phosphatase RsbU (regulator of sigma subunit)